MKPCFDLKMMFLPGRVLIWLTFSLLAMEVNCSMGRTGMQGYGALETFTHDLHLQTHRNTYFPVLSHFFSHKVCRAFYEPFTSSCMPHSSSMVTQASMGKAISLPLRFRCSSRDLPNDGFSTHASATQNSSSSSRCNQTRTDVRLHSSCTRWIVADFKYKEGWFEVKEIGPSENWS